MSRKNPEREALLAQVRNRQRAAGAKISRLKAKGIKIGGTKNDPRRPLPRVSKYNTRQLESYLKELNGFTSRATKFNADARGRVLPQSAVERYKAAERAVNMRKKRALDKIGNIPVPGAGNGVTIKQRLKINTPSRPRALSAANPFTFETRDTRQIANAKALAELTKNLENKLKVDFLGMQLESGRKAARDMLTDLRQPDMIAQLDAMSDFHFNILWNATSFAKDVAGPYHIAASLIGKGSKSDQWMDDIFEENIEYGNQLIQDVLKIKER